MSPVIRIDDVLFARLQKLATPFVDTPASVLERVLDERDRLLGQTGSEQKTPSVVVSNVSISETSVATEPRPSLSTHPRYERGHHGSQTLHDQLKRQIELKFSPEVVAERNSLIFKAPNNFAAIQAVAVRKPELDISIFGSVSELSDPKGVLKRGRFEHWSSFKLESESQIDYAIDLITQSFTLRHRGR